MSQLDLSDQFRRKIEESGFTIEELGEKSQVDPRGISRFLKKKRDITMATASKLAEVINLRLIESDRPKGRKPSLRK